MERVLLFVDYANINAGAMDYNYEFDYQDFMNYIAEGRFLIDSYIYVPVDPRNEHKRDRLIEDLWLNGYLVNKKTGTIAGNTYKCDFDVEITMDITNAIHQVKPDIVVLASGDSDFVPLVIELRKHGIRVEVASFSNGASKNMIMRASGFINLDLYCNENDMEAETEIETDYRNELIKEYESDENEDDNSDFEKLERITEENKAQKEKEESENLIRENIIENINEPLVENINWEIDKNTEGDKKNLSESTKNKENKDKKPTEVDIDISIEDFKDPWAWE